MYLLHKEIYTKDPLVIPYRKMFTYRGQARGILRDLNGRILQDTGWINNSFTTYGDQNIGVTGMNYLAIGTGTGATLPGDVLLKNEVARGFAGDYSRLNEGSPNYVFNQVRTERFDAGVGTGLITEVGVHGGSSGSNLMCRAEITPIDKQAANVLDMYYKIICTPDLTDKTGQVVINGITYDYIMRPYNVGLYTESWDTFGPNGSTGTNYMNPNLIPASVASPYPSGNDAVVRINTVRNGSTKTVTWDCIAYLNDCNFTLPNGIKSMYCRLNFGQLAGTEGGIGVQLLQAAGQPNPGQGVPKDDTQYFTASWRATWAATT